jgi:hypothetical protein
MLRRYEVEIGHQLAGIVEAGEVADLGNHRCGDDESYTTHGLHSLDHRCHRPLRRQLFDLLGQAVYPGLDVGHGMNVILQDELARRVIEANRGQPAPVSQGPTLLAGVDPPMPQQESL